jgi:hypothetical protein
VSELTLLIFKVAFLIALWVFVFFVVAAVRRDLFGERVTKLSAAAAKQARDIATVFVDGRNETDRSQPAVPGGELATSGRLSRTLELVVISGSRVGDRLALTTEPVSIGRSSDSTVVIRDDFTSSHHARLEYRSGSWVVSDLGSTNGTFLAGKRITAPTVLQIDQPLTIGATTFAIQAV